MFDVLMEKLEARQLLTAVVGTGTGLLAAYYNNEDFTGPVHHKIDKQINYYFGEAKPAGGIGVDHYSVIWQGEIQSQYRERYTFYTESDDGIEVILNGQVIINDLTNHPITEDSFSIKMRAGRKYPLVVKYYNDTQVGEAELLWSSASITKQAVPESQLYPVQESVPAVSHPTASPAIVASSSTPDVLSDSAKAHVWD